MLGQQYFFQFPLLTVNLKKKTKKNSDKKFTKTLIYNKFVCIYYIYAHITYT